MDVIGRPTRSIRHKLDRLVLLSVGAALALSALLNCWQEAGRYLDGKRETLFATAHVFAAATSKAVAAGNGPAARQAIRAAARMPGLMRVEIQERNGGVLAEIGTTVRLRGDLDLNGATGAAPLTLLTTRTMQLSVPIVDGDEEVGRLVLISDAGDLTDRFSGAVLTTAAGSAVALVIGLVLAHRLQRSITRPLVTLAQAMTRVTTARDYNTVFDVATDDETGLLAGAFKSMVQEVRRSTDEILTREDEIIGRLARAAEQRDDQTGEHVIRVATISRVIARQLGLDPKWIDDLYRASPMHDIGKISIPDAILFKPGRLDPDERATMESHALAGWRVLAGSKAPLVHLAAEIAISHHERWDGAGYPYGLKGTAIPLSGRITAVADVCDALLSVRPYKQPWSLEAVRAHLEQKAGSHFDPACVAALLARWADLEAIYAPPTAERRLAA